MRPYIPIPDNLVGIEKVANQYIELSEDQVDSRRFSVVICSTAKRVLFYYY